ncbi:DUF4349 domain-containing protein [Fictibacillus barbaricus]|uniref:DUF4349 domain-containing protein n=1 Tax=Fictibacillus barbaricus TaxID=182136 RepID=A0ABU1TX83_9BACL|nr:DUF4349 domain-containing protein [Fictibacillus barbaricus]MDR7071821.1 hypothetical protein [Fictibacillus barbaricus]
MWKKRKVYMFLFVLLLLGACSSGESSNKSMDESGGVSSGKMEENKALENSDKADSKTNRSDEKSAESIKDQRKVIYHADIRIKVEKLQSSMEKVKMMIEEKGGYIVESNTSNDESGYEDGMIIARVPMNEFRPFLTQVKSISRGKPNESVRGEDVTEEYVDLSSRLKAKLQVRDRLESFMKNAHKTEDLLSISSDLANVQEEIEQIQGRLTFLKNQSDYSTVTINFGVKNLKAEKLQTEELNTWKKTKKLFMETVNFFVSAISFIIVGLIGLAPLWLILIGALYLLWRRKNRQKKKPESPTSVS